MNYNVSFNSLRKFENTQSGPFGEIMCRTDIGTSVGHFDKPALLLIVWVILFLVSWLAMMLSFLGKCSSTYPNWATCTTANSLPQLVCTWPFINCCHHIEVVATNMSFLANWYPHTAITNTIGISSLVSFLHSLAHCNCSHLWLNTAPQSQDPEASAWIRILGTVVA